MVERAVTGAHSLRTRTLRKPALILSVLEGDLLHTTRLRALRRRHVSFLSEMSNRVSFPNALGMLEGSAVTMMPYKLDPDDSALRAVLVELDRPVIVDGIERGRVIVIFRPASETMSRATAWKWTVPNVRLAYAAPLLEM